MNNKSFGNDKCKEIGEFNCPYCQEHLIMNPRQYANHIRWCKENPGYEYILEETSQNIKEANKRWMIKKWGDYKKFEVICAKCGKHFEIEEREYKFNPNKKYHCSRSCANTRVHTDESKLKVSESLRKRYNKNTKIYTYQGVQYNYKKVCENCGKEFYTDKPQQKFCCKECVIHHRNNNYLNKLVINGYDYKQLLSIYRRQCEFKFGISSYPNEFDFELIKKNGWYKAKNHGNNLHGVSRDHMFSVKEGFEQQIDPYLISHPANCQLLIHTDNESKHSKCTISLDELRERVMKWNEKYGEYPNTINYEVLNTLGVIIK